MSSALSVLLDAAKVSAIRPPSAAVSQTMAQSGFQQRPESNDGFTQTVATACPHHDMAANQMLMSSTGGTRFIWKMQRPKLASSSVTQ